jgi:hypothetical protein
MRNIRHPLLSETKRENSCRILITSPVLIGSPRSELKQMYENVGCILKGKIWYVWNFIFHSVLVFFVVFSLLPHLKYLFSVLPLNAVKGSVFSCVYEAPVTCAVSLQVKSPLIIGPTRWLILYPFGEFSDF